MRGSQLGWLVMLGDEGGRGRGEACVHPVHESVLGQCLHTESHSTVLMMVTTVLYQHSVAQCDQCCCGPCVAALVTLTPLLLHLMTCDQQQHHVILNNLLHWHQHIA